MKVMVPLSFASLPLLAVSIGPSSACSAVSGGQGMGISSWLQRAYEILLALS